MQFFRSIGQHLGAAAADVLLVSFIALMPLLLARLGPLATPNAQSVEPFWGFLTNGQLAFYSINSLAVILVAVFRQKLPKTMSFVVGAVSLVTLLFLAWLIGIDPRLQNAPLTFVGVTALYIYIAVQVCRIIVEAAKQIDQKDALAAGEKTSKRVTQGLAERKGVSADD